MFRRHINQLKFEIKNSFFLKKISSLIFFSFSLVTTRLEARRERVGEREWELERERETEESEREKEARERESENLQKSDAQARPEK